MASARQVRAARERDWRRCRGRDQYDSDAFIYWAEKYAKIQHPEHGSIYFTLRPAQREIIASWMAERYTIVLKARQIGWSTLVAVYCLWLAFFWPDRVIVMLSRNEREAMKLLQKSDYAYKRLPPWMREHGPKRLDNNVTKITFDNASSIESMPSKDDPARGSAVTLIVVDEWAFFDNAEEAWASIEPVTDVGGRVIGLSTANGAGDFFETFWNMAVQQISKFKPMFYSWDANTDRDEAWYEAKKATMLEWQLHQEYPRTPEEAFIKSGRPVFDTDLLRQLPTRKPTEGILLTPNGMRAPQFVRQDGGVLSIYQMPRVNHAYVIGADVSEGLEHGDYSAAHVMDVTTGEIVAVWHGHIDPDLLGDELFKLGFFYNVALVGPEANNQGLTTVKKLQRLSYPKLFMMRSVTDRTAKGKLTVRAGWWTNQQTKMLLVGELQEALREQSIGLEDQPTIGELVTYRRDDKGKMAGSPFDDRVMSLGITNQLRKYHHEYVLEDEDVAPPGSFDWYLAEVLEDEELANERVIGAHNVRDGERLHRVEHVPW